MKQLVEDMMNRLREAIWAAATIRALYYTMDHIP